MSTIQRVVYIHHSHHQSHLNQKVITVPLQVVMMKATVISQIITNKSSEGLDFGQQYPNYLQEESNQFIWILCLPNLRNKNFVILIFDARHHLETRKETKKMRRYCIIPHQAQIRDANDYMRVEGTIIWINFFQVVVYSKAANRKRSRSVFAISVCCGWLSIISFICTIICLCLVFLAVPLQSVEAITFGNVLGTQKQLIFNLHVRAR